MGQLTLSAYTGKNDEVFARVMAMHVPKGSVVADVTYGKGAFWKRTPTSHYDLRATDLKTGVDCRKLPYADGSIDCVVLDPPYIEGFYRHNGSLGLAGHSDFHDRYGLPERYIGTKKYHEAVLEMYQVAGAEAHRVLPVGGVLIVKCQDEVSNHQQHLTHVEIINSYAQWGLYCKDLFVVVRTDTPRISRLVSRQEHARKNHSYFLVFIKQAKKPRRRF